MTTSDYALLRSFRSVFEGVPYRHRDSSLGDRVAHHLYEDLYKLGKSSIFNARVESHVRVVNTQNKTVGIKRRRGDGTFGELVPAAVAITEEGFSVGRGPIATIEIGVETKILAKAMIKQIDRVIGDLIRQTEEFKRKGGNPICVGLVGVNFSHVYKSFEGDREFLTDGRTYKHPVQESSKAVDHLRNKAQSKFDEFLLLEYLATNVEPFPFSWRDEAATVMEYSALLTRVSREYDRRFA